MKKSLILAVAASCILVSSTSAQQGHIDPKRKPAVHAAAKSAHEAAARMEAQVRSKRQAKKAAGQKSSKAMEAAKRMEAQMRAKRQANQAKKTGKNGG